MRGIATMVLTLSILLLVAPAQAQRFGIFFGDEPSDFVPEFAVCLNDNQIRNWIAGQGYTDIALNVPDSKHVQVRASKGGATYLLDFNYCTGRIEDRQRIR
jgi:hypothetical protein